jgi:hypothetical protein
MTPARSTTSLGAILDRTRWDYAPRDRNGTDLLSPAGSLFSTVPWDQTVDDGPTTTPEASSDADARDQDVVTTLR